MATSSQSASSSRAKSANAPKTGNPRGFAAMDPATQRRIASEGGKASHESGRGHQWTPEEARAAGRKGGQASRTTALPPTANSRYLSAADTLSGSKCSF